MRLLSIHFLDKSSPTSGLTDWGEGAGIYCKVDCKSWKEGIVISVIVVHKDTTVTLKSLLEEMKPFPASSSLEEEGRVLVEAGHRVALGWASRLQRAF